jgi:uncharacterized Fe-S cluster-containing radical SAM superfamily protein
MSVDQAAGVLLAGQHAYRLPAARLGGGEPAQQALHLLALTASYLELSRQTLIAGRSPVLVIETNGHALTCAIADRLVRHQDGQRIHFEVSMKATDPDQLARLTRTGDEIAQRRHEAQCDLLDHLAALGARTHVVLLDEYSDLDAARALIAHAPANTSVEVRHYRGRFDDEPEWRQPIQA